MVSGEACSGNHILANGTTVKLTATAFTLGSREPSTRVNGTWRLSTALVQTPTSQGKLILASTLMASRMDVVDTSGQMVLSTSEILKTVKSTAKASGQAAGATQQPHMKVAS